MVQGLFSGLRGPSSSWPDPSKGMCGSGFGGKVQPPLCPVYRYVTHQYRDVSLHEKNQSSHLTVVNQ